jgi:uncharacterized protein YcbK (DUF882 family)
LEEFVCRDPAYDLVRISPKLIEKLEEIRKATGEHPLLVTCSYRPYAYNATLPGAAQNSFHIDGLAADVYSNGLSVGRLGEIADKIIGDTGGVGLYYGDGFVHVDVRGERSRW